MNEIITVEIKATTGSTFELKLPANGTVDEMRWQVARKLQLSRDRLTFIHRENVVKTGRLADHGIVNGSRITLLPNIEAGFTTSSQGTEQSVVQAIESLSDQQIDDFLSGRDPLTLALRVEDHMMFIQLQLEQQSKEKRKSRHRRSQQQQPQSTPQPGPSGLQKVSKSRKRNAQSAQTIQIPAEAQLSLNQLLAAAGGDGASLAALAPLFGLAQPLPSTQLSQQARNQATTQPSNQPRNQPTNKPNNQPNNQTKVELTSSPSNQQKPEASSSSSKKPTDQASTSTSDAAVKDAKKPRPSIYSGTFSGSLHPSIQDIQGNPRRDPRTILLILRDLLSATNQQQFIPQILRGGNGVMVGAPGARISTRQTKSSIPVSKSSTSNSKISKSRLQKAHSSTLRRMKNETNKVTPQYVQWLSRVKSENEVTRSKMADLQEAMRRKKERRAARISRNSDQFTPTPDSENQQVHQIPIQHNIAIQQLQQQPMQTDDDNQLASMSDCVTV